MGRFCRATASTSTGKLTDTMGSNAFSSDLWQLRADLQFRWVDGSSADQGYWVVKDPLARQWFCLTGIEKRILSLADGRRSIAEICQLAIEAVRPLETSFDAMVSFLIHARRSGLLITVGGSGPLERFASSSDSMVVSNPPRRRLASLLAYRFPGFNPNVFAGTLRSITKPLQRPAVLIALMLVGMVAIAIVFSRFDILATEIAAAFSRRDSMWWIWVLVTIAIAKSIHELAHVVACRMVGAECREIGIMLLLGTPCLYCDVSDLWTVPQTSKRVFVSAAGMIAELGLASIATVVWAVTHPSTLHDLALVVMVVCSVSTVLVNANPLLRYDGYFMLADWLRVPNLAEQSSQALRRRLRQFIWGSAVGHGVEEVAHPDRIGRRLPESALLAYGISSGLYRTFVIAVISLVIYKATVGLGLGWLGLALGLSILGGMLIRAVSPLLQPADGTTRSTAPSDPASNAAADLSASRWWQNPRVVTIIALALLLAWGLLAIPLPRTILLPVLVVPSGEQELYASESGRVVRSQPSGCTVDAGEVLVQLANTSIEDQLHRAQAKVAHATAIREAWRLRRGAESGSSTGALLAEKQLQIAITDLQQIQTQADRLTIKSPLAGRFDIRPLEPRSPLDRDLQPGQWIESGTQIGWLGHPTKRGGNAIASQQQIDAIRVDQAVWLRHPTFSSAKYSGRVRQIDRGAADQLPAELAASLQDADLAQPHYLVQIDFADSAPIPLAKRSVAVVEVHVDAMNCWDRLRRLVFGEFRGL
ncbi:hypothetical protein NHH03_14910 [Stieleria sp. TO1_6]|uniref:hypothetical protein n=1 Tax=Stieleria tagensis TaxID=2956795 RepID=UPI00209B1D66|nr:hypothetical protein [Stieleria tagensis]MCO8123037.1 hypothetical protein [Stieleria tagensis]